MGAIAGGAIGGVLFLLLMLSGLFVYRRRRIQRKIALAHRSLPAPRSALLAGEDDFDLTSPSLPVMGEAGPQLLRPRGQETGSIFHEGVWPPPGASSRLEDPLLSGSNVDLTSIVDTVMGRHDRSSSGGSVPSTAPLLANESPSRGGQHSPSASAFVSSASQSAARRHAGFSSGPDETTPLDPHGHAHQGSMDSAPGSPRSHSAYLPPGAAPPSPPGKRDYPDGASTTRSGTLPSHARGPSTLGSLMVVNNTPEVEEEDPLVDVGPSHHEPVKEIPPLYHTIRRDTNDTWYSDRQNDAVSPTRGGGATQEGALSPTDVGRAI